MYKTSALTIALISVFLLILPSMLRAAPQVYCHPQYANQFTPGGKTAIMAVDTMYSEVFDNTGEDAPTEISDSFFLAASAKLIGVEVSKKFAPVVKKGLFLTPSAKRNGFSNLDTTQKCTTFADTVKAFALESGAALVVVPFRVSMKHITYKPEGWRDSPSYEQPASYRAVATVHLQLWKADGTLLAEKIIVKDSGKPFLYNLMKKKQSSEDIARYASRFYAPPILKALNKAVIGAVLF